jgi:hypothetical protein
VLTGWRNQQLARRLAFSTAEQREGVVRGFATRARMRATLSELLDDGTGQIRPELQGAGRQPEGHAEPDWALNWLRNNRSCPPYVRGLARGRIELPHQGWHEPGRRTVAHLRDLLTDGGALPPIDRQHIYRQHIYRQHRPMVERSIACLVRGGNRKARYRGIAKNDQWLDHRLAGLDLQSGASGRSRFGGVWPLVISSQVLIKRLGVEAVAPDESLPRQQGDRSLHPVGNGNDDELRR